MDTQPEIPQGQTREEIQQREKIIKDFYANWIAINPTKHIFNIALNDFIHVRFLSIQETAEHAAFTYKSTLAVTAIQQTHVWKNKTDRWSVKRQWSKDSILHNINRKNDQQPSSSRK